MRIALPSLLLCLSGLLAACASSAGSDASASVSEQIRVPVDGAELYLELRGEHADAPLLLWLHGGPGAAERPLFRLFDSGLEHDFLVAYLDQRGTGRSFDPDADPAALTIEQHLADLDRVVDRLLARSGRERLALVGHSWGTVLALLYVERHPDKLSGVVTVGQVVAPQEASRLQIAFVQREARARGEADAAARLVREIGPPPLDWQADLALQRRVEDFGGVFHRPPNRWGTLLGAVARGLVGPFELPRLIRANNVSLQAMNAELARLDLRTRVTRLQVPWLMVSGRFDQVTPAALAEPFFAGVSAPWKCALTFDDSGHNVPFEEPAAFQAAVRDFLLRAQAGPAGACPRP